MPRILAVLLLASSLVAHAHSKMPVVKPSLTPEEKAIKHAEKLGGKVKREVIVHLWRCDAKDDDLKVLAGLQSITELNLEGTKITDAGLKHLTQFPNLNSLNLSGTGVTDAGIKELSPLKNLASITLGDAITDAGFKELAALKNLKTVNVPFQGKVSPQADEALRTAIPGVIIFRKIGKTLQ